MSVPASIILGIISSLQEAGPKLATTFVLRTLSSKTRGLLASCGWVPSYTCGLSKSRVVSASKEAAASAITDSHGYLPLAASPLSITASAPSQMAF